MKISRLFRRILMLLAVLFFFGINAFNVSPALAADYDLTQIYFLCDTNGTIADFSDGTAAMLNRMLADISDFDCSDIKTPIKCDGNTVTKWKHGNDTGILGGDLCDYIKGTMKAEYGYSLYAEEIATETCSAGQMLVDGACVEPEFTITTTNMAAGKVFKFNISASGTFYVDFDDGRGVQKIDRTNKITNTTYTSAAYANAGTHIIKMYGDATGYSTANYTAAISFNGNKNIKSVDGSLGSIFGGSARSFMFYSTFNDCTSLQSIPENLFSGVTGSSNYMFYYTFGGCTSLQSIPETLFSGVTGSADSMFRYTFQGCTSLQSIPETLFSGVTGSSDSMFGSTFGGCTSLQSIPENLFAGVTGSAYQLFGYTFSGCTSLRSIPETLFSGVTGSAYQLFDSTFQDCTSLQSIPETLFSGVTGSSDSMFYSTFSGCTSLQSIPENLFAGITGSAEFMFGSTFRGCTSLQSIPENLFAGVTGSAGEMFSGTFSGCTSLRSIPESLFAGVTGSAYGMFGYTFRGCTSLQSIPENLFAGVTDGAENMFESTFSDCTSLQSLPSGLFKNITGKPAFGAFAYAFYGCTNLTGYIPYDMFAGLEYASGAMIEIFNNTALDTICPAGTYQYITSFESDWSGHVACASCPENSTSAAGATDIGACVCNSGYAMVDGVCTKVDCAENQMMVDGACVEPEFTITTTEMVANDVFSFKLSAKGKYFIDWGDGESKPINKTTVSSETISHTYSEDGVYKIRFIGDATAYPSKKVVVSFKDNLYIQELHGSLGAIFGGSNAYMFNGTFEGCTNLSLISETLFNGVTESADSMFNSTFQGCSSLKAIPGGLFDILNGAEYQASQQMFMETFRDCTALTEIPGELFSKVTGGATGLFEATFRGCVSLTTIYADLFNHFSVSADNMFGGIFWGCPSLSSIPSGLFDNITAGANSLFYSTFRETAVTEVPSGLFANITTGAASLFDRTFYGCFNLTTIPDNLFAGITSTENADSMFNSTFYGCTLLNTLPENLFSNIQGDTPPDMFRQTFKGCKGFVDTYIPKNFFAGLTLPVDVSAADVMNEIFSGTSLLQKCPAGTYKYTTEFSSAWSGKVSCAPCPAGTTSAAGASDISQCVAGRTLHIGDDITMNLTTTRPETPRVMVFQVLNELYYGGLSDTEKTINKNTDKKFRIFFDNKDYWLHDYTVE